MRSSLQRRFAVGMAVPLVVGAVAAGYVLQKFRGYEDSASHVMAGDQKSVIQGRLLEARVKAAAEMAQASVASEQADAAFRERLQSIHDDMKALAREGTDKSLDEARKSLASLLAAKTEQLEDIFVQYRNIKTTAFNTYRLAWANKWMTVAHNVGLIINDLDNLPYHGGERAAASVYSKIAPLVSLITRAHLAHESKLTLFSQLNTLKAQVGRYTEALTKSEKARVARTDGLTAAGAALKKYNDTQGKAMTQFSNEARTEVFKGIMAFALYLLFAMGWYAAMLKRFGAHVEGVAGHLAHQFKSWISAGGNLTAQGLIRPERPDREFDETYAAIDQAMRRVATLRKEDVLVKRLLNVPFVLVNRQKQAIFWNSALSILARVRALEEMGPVSYPTLLRFTSAQGKVVDPIEKAFAENREVSQLALLRLADDGIAVHAVCTPVQGPDHQTEYVMVHIRDLRDENRRAEAELDRQLETVRTAVQFVRSGKTPPEAGPTLRRPVVEAVSMLRAHSLELQEKAGIIAGQVETMRDRMTREATLKKTVHGRMDQLRGEVRELREQLAGIRGFSDDLIARVGQIEGRYSQLRAEYDDIRRRGVELSRDLKKSQGLVASCIERLEATEELSGRVRANERMIRSILEKSTVLNANNSILGSRRELTPADVVTITENLTQLMGQFDRSYRFIEQSVSEVESGIAQLAAGLRDNLAVCSKFSADDAKVITAVTHSERLMTTAGDETAEFARQTAGLKQAATRLDAQVKGVETKLQHLTQIAQASLELQSQLELGFRGMFERVAAPVANREANA